MCPRCQAEYDNPLDRRFHAQPNACDLCGPQVFLTDSKGVGLGRGDKALLQCAEHLVAGKIVAIKGLGGFHLVCRADNHKSVCELRQRKIRDTKPFAIMVASVDDAKKIALVSDAEASLLLSPAHPIVLVRKKGCSNFVRNNGSSNSVTIDISEALAPKTSSFGIMLPYTPLHSIILSDCQQLSEGRTMVPLVMTSANMSGEPLCYINEEAQDKLSLIADYFLFHNRDIERPLDDSVCIVTEEGIGVPIRRARGYVPSLINLPEGMQSEGNGSVIKVNTLPDPANGENIAHPVIIAAGGDMKAAICIADGSKAIMSEHLGELSSPSAFRNYIRAGASLQQLLEMKPAVAACDKHPGYNSADWAAKLGLPVIKVQHHHAHIVSCMADNGITGKVFGLACDGTGYGDDGSVWGCELFLCDEVEYTRVGSLKSFPLPGGDKSARELWRPALSLLIEVFGNEWLTFFDRLVTPVDAVKEGGMSSPDIRQAAQFVAKRIIGSKGKSGSVDIVRTSSLGRLFDAVAFILGVSETNHHEAEAAMALEASALDALALDAFASGGWDTHEEFIPSMENSKQEDSRLSIQGGKLWQIVEENGLLVMDVSSLIKQLVLRKFSGHDIKELALLFHKAVAAMLSELIIVKVKENGIDRAVLSGGCFINSILSSLVRKKLEDNNVKVYTHRQVPAGDGGIALGQALCASRTILRRGL
jgi:hydrogenase maturation protein HypF